MRESLRTCSVLRDKCKLSLRLVGMAVQGPGRDLATLYRVQWEQKRPRPFKYVYKFMEPYVTMSW